MSTQQTGVIEVEPVVGAAARRRRIWPWVILTFVLGAIAVAAVFLLSGPGGGGGIGGDLPVAKVSEGDLQITVVEDAELDAHDYHAIECKVPGGSTIKTIHVKDGDVVEVGTPLFDLDTEGLEEKITNRELEVENAMATLDAAEKDLDIRIKLNETAEKKAGDAVALAKLDMDKYLLGEYPIACQEAELAIKQTQRRLDIARDDLAGSKKARTEEFVTQREVEQNELAVADAEFNLKKAANNLTLLKQYTYPREKRNRESKYEIALEDLERTKQQNVNERAKIERDVKNKQIAYDLKAERLKELKDNLKNSVVVADRAGVINFNHSGHRWRRTMIEEGARVRERQVVMKIPDTSKMIVKFTISERDRYRVKMNNPAVVTVATMPDAQLYATITNKSSRPDAGQWWANPDVKLFACEASLNAEQPQIAEPLKLSPNTSAKVRIFIDTFKNVLYVPVQSLFRVGRESLLATVVDGRPRLVKVEAGEANEDFIHIKSGVVKGQPVLLALNDTLRKELQLRRDAAAKQETENNEPPPAEARDAATPAVVRPPAPAAGTTALTADERTKLTAVMTKLRDPANKDAAKQKAIIDELPAALRKKIEPILKAMRAVRSGNSTNGERPPRGERSGRGRRPGGSGRGPR